MGENKPANEARYIHGEFGKGTWSWYGGHDPEDYEHRVGDPKTDLALHPNSPGYRLILNNVLFPAAKKKKQKPARRAGKARRPVLRQARPGPAAPPAPAASRRSSL